MRKRDRTKRESNYDEQRENELYCANKESNDCDAQTKSNKPKDSTKRESNCNEHRE